MNSKLIIPIFPLNGEIFFPNTNLPLNIFETRYIEMIDYALSNQKKIGIIQIKDNNNFYSVGCVGKINFYNETKNGKYIINLTGLNYFTLGKEIISKNKFKIHETTIISSKKNNSVILNETKYKKLVELYLKYIEINKIKIDISFINQVEKSLSIKFIAISSTFTIPEKQMLLETFDINKLMENIIILLEFYLKRGESKSIN